MEFGLRPIGVYAYAPAGSRNAEGGNIRFRIAEWIMVKFVLTIK